MHSWQFTKGCSPILKRTWQFCNVTTGFVQITFRHRPSYPFGKNLCMDETIWSCNNIRAYILPKQPHYQIQTYVFDVNINRIALQCQHKWTQGYQEAVQQIYNSHRNWVFTWKVRKHHRLCLSEKGHSIMQFIVMKFASTVVYISGKYLV